MLIVNTLNEITVVVYIPPPPPPSSLQLARPNYLLNTQECSQYSGAWYSFSVCSSLVGFRLFTPDELGDKILVEHFVSRFPIFSHTKLELFGFSIMKMILNQRLINNFQHTFVYALFNQINYNKKKTKTKKKTVNT